MAGIRKGRQSFAFEKPPVITAWASVAGKKEAQGPLGSCFDITTEDNRFGQPSWEQAEKTMQQLALSRLLEMEDLQKEQLGMVFSGDLLNQCIGSSFSLRNTGIPHIGLYGACSTMAEGLALAAMAVGGGFRENAAAITSSHFAASERQYRFPLGYGGQRTPTSQWTVTGAGAALVAAAGEGIKIEGCTLGTVEDLCITDAANMGAAMAPAAFSTIKKHFLDFGVSAMDYDWIVTGDLGQLGKDLLLELSSREGIPLGGKLQDCGCLIFDNLTQGVGSGGSGCGCSASVLCGYLLNQLQYGEVHRILFCGTGALLSPLSTQQGLPIPSICHAVSIAGSPR